MIRICQLRKLITIYYFHLIDAKIVNLALENSAVAIAARSQLTIIEFRMPRDEEKSTDNQTASVAERTILRRKKL